MASWTDKQRRFVEEYCRDFNGAAAARRAGYSERGAKKAANRNLNDPDIRAAVDERLERLAMSAEEATKRMSDIARGDIGQFFEVVEYEKELDDGTIETRTTLALDEEAVIENGEGLIKQVRFNESGRPNLKLYDAQKALRLILKAHGEYNHTQEHEHSGELDVGSDTLDDVLSTLTDRAERLGEEE
jgi:phage terminase small subunit